MATTKANPTTITAFTCESCCKLKPLPKDGYGPCDECRQEDTDADLFNDTIGVCPGPTETMISERVWYGRQSVNCERIVAYGDKRIRYLVEVDAYDFQSSARAELWNGEKWHSVHYIPGQEIASRNVSYVTKGVTVRAFAGDLAELERVVKAVIS